MKKGLCIFIMAIALISCDNELYKAESKRIEGGTWNKDEVIIIPMGVKDTTSTFDYFVTLRNTEDYPYENIFLFIDLEFPNGRTLRDTLGVDLTTVDGRWKGKGAGSSYDNRILVNRKMRFPLMGEYVFRIRQAMRVEELEGVQTVGIEFDYVQ